MSIKRQLRIWNEEQDKWLDDFKTANPKKYTQFMIKSTDKQEFIIKQREVNRLTNKRIQGQRQRRLNEEIENDARQEISNMYIRKYRTLVDDFFKGGKVDQKKTGPYKLLRKVRNPGNINRNLQRSRPTPGQWYLFMYDPKGKKDLKFYDRLPLVLVLDTFRNGFIGLNFHHMHPRFRRRFIQFAEQFRRGQGLYSYLDINWNVIKTLDKYKFGRPIIRRYNYTQVRSRMIKVPEDDWELMVVIPSLRLFKMQTQAVWQETTREALRS